MANPIHHALAQLLDEHAALTLQELARACSQDSTWVTERVSSGLLQADLVEGHWRFAGATVLRARRLAQLETTFDADPELAALTADLIEEVTQLRQRLRQLQAQLG
ncbi:hypothetical protein GCM10022279_09390 [Comamonas faecalis]|uniref:MerR family transcriptional regulator n=1 Tax=Comamonas faecalis TaxID=1387849 RepID=A0ABP7QWX3_9BURK